MFDPKGNRAIAYVLLPILLETRNRRTDYSQGRPKKHGIHCICLIAAWQQTVTASKPSLQAVD